VLVTQDLDLVIFDFDGVIADTVVDIASAANEVLDRYGMPGLPVADVRSYIGGGAEALVHRMLTGREDVDLDEAARLFKECYGACYADRTVLYPGVREVLAALDDAGTLIAVATNKMESLTHGLVRKLEIEGHFRVIVGPESIGRRKPDPEAVTRILDALAVDAGRALMVGDTAGDIASGRSAGTFTCGVLYGYGTEAEIAGIGPDFTIRRINELLEQLPQLAGTTR
jgi:phosphoglycolate phosphatase